MGKPYEAELTLSFCNENQFTCNDGICLNMEYRCDGTAQCEDSSDEDDCRLVVKDIGFSKFKTPPPTKENYLEVNTTFNIMSVPNVDENGNKIKVIVRFMKRWFNGLLTFKDLSKIKENILFGDDKKDMYSPFLIGVNVENFCVKTPNPEKLILYPHINFDHLKSPLTDPHNAYYFKGSETAIYQEWDWACEHICTFVYHWYPFDTQNCPMIHNTTSPKERIVAEHIFYSGKVEVGRYNFQNINFCDVDKEGRTGLFIDFTIQRPVLNNLITLFLPTGMLLIISQLSVVFKDLVIEVNTTLLLVLTT